MVESWQLKLRRAKHHFKDIESRIKHVAKPGRRAFRVEKEHRADGNWYYSVHMDVAIDVDLPVVIGDFLFNLRSALDHIACATANRKSQFPIYIEDIWRQPTDAREAERLKRERAKWDRWTKGMKPGVLAVVEQAQPYNAIGRATDPEDNALALFNDLHNADKHRELLIVQDGIFDPVSTIKGIPGPYSFAQQSGTAGIMRDCAVFLSYGQEVDVEFVGEAQVAIASGPQSRYRGLPDALNDLYGEVGAVIGFIESVM